MSNTPPRGDLALPLTVYDGAGTDRVSVSAWRTMFREIWESRELVNRLVSRNIVGQFRQSFLGYLWIALPPIATTAVFTLLSQARIMQIPSNLESSLPYPLFVLIGTTLWGLFTQVCMMATTSISNAGSLVSKIYFPREVLILSSTGNALVNFAIRVVVVILVFALFLCRPHWQALLTPLLVLPLLVFGLGLGLLLAPINTMMNDVSRMLEFAFQFGMFLAPTVYPTPALGSGGWQDILFWGHKLDPVSHVIYAVDTAVGTGGWVPTAGYVVTVMISFLTLAIGWRFFHICEPLLAERL